VPYDEVLTTVIALEPILAHIGYVMERPSKDAIEKRKILTKRVKSSRIYMMHGRRKKC